MNYQQNLGKDELHITCHFAALGLQPEDVRVRQIVGQEALSSSYVYSLECVSPKQNLTHGALYGKYLSFEIGLSTGKQRLSGFVSFVEYIGRDLERDQEKFLYRFQLSPWLFWMDKQPDQRVFAQTTLAFVVSEIFKKYPNFNPRWFHLPKEDKKIPLCVQYKESDAFFLLRLIEEEGGHAFFQHGENEHTLFWETWEKETHKKKEKKIIKIEKDFFLLQLPQEAMGVLGKAESHLPWLTPGMSFQFQGEDYLVVERRFDSKNLLEKDSCLFSLSFVSLSVEKLPNRKYARPHIGGLVRGFVAGSPKGELLLEENKVPIKFHWDKYNSPQKEDTVNACLAPVSQVWAGFHHGAHLIPRVGDEVYVCFVDGDPCQPIVVGSESTEEKPSYLEKSNLETETLLHTVSGHEIRLDDAEKKEKISVNSSRDMEFLTQNTLLLKQTKLTLSTESEVHATQKNLTLTTEGEVRATQKKIEIRSQQSVLLEVEILGVKTKVEIGTHHISFAAGSAHMGLDALTSTLTLRGFSVINQIGGSYILTGGTMIVNGRPVLTVGGV